LLSAPYDPDAGAATQILPQVNRVTDRAESFPTQPSILPPLVSIERPSSSVKWVKWLVLVAILVTLVLGVLVGANWDRIFKQNDSAIGSAQPERSGEAPRVEMTPVPTESPLVPSAATPTPTPTARQQVNVRGNWSGMFAGRPASLNIDNQQGDSFTGTLRNTKGAIVAVSGTINPESRELIMQEDRVIQPVSEGPEWALGRENGTLSSDGRTMSGRGTDQAGHSYTWTFSR
jgi:hypothetical protein